ncbi:hypothetical protein THAOC_23417 [Thalassiosira oceanica]|uniref:Uncharacterized protein n=1 Tax=Thalassiosira oceanica TaxID=159749 RepID=K0RUM3_THAOC|nr:hypothetical protein THAOC_23417 [Thalassiosira oceanica]|eukprot:EJK56655.1 hypothetical protein THAOC_23417 [Thalassiosira oceanica]
MTPAARKNQETPAAGLGEASRPGAGPAALCRSAVRSITRTPKKILRTRPLRALAYSAPQGVMTPPRKNQETPAAGLGEATRPGAGPAALCHTQAAGRAGNQTKSSESWLQARGPAAQRAREGEGHPFPSPPSAGEAQPTQTPLTHPAPFKRVPVRPPNPCRKPARNRAPREPLHIRHEPASSSPPPGSRAERTVRVVSTDRHLQNELGRAAFVHLQQTNIGHIDGHFVDENHVPVCACFPTTISFDHDPSTGQPILSVTTRRDETSFTTYDGHHRGIEQWRAEWGEMPDAVEQIYQAIDRAEGLRGQIQSQYITVDLPHVAKPDVRDLAAHRADDKLLDRSVENYRDLQVDHYWEEQRKAREKLGEGAPGEYQGIPRPIFSYEALSSKVTNSVQDEVMSDFLDNTAVGAYDILRKNGCVVTHLCNRSEDFNFDNERLSPDNTAPQVYHEGVRDKFGSAARGDMRLTHMRDDHIARGIEPPRAYSVVDIANLPLDVQLETVDFLLNEFKRFASPRLPRTLREMLVQDMQGASVGTQTLFSSIVEPYDPQQILTGGIALRGSLTATFRNTIESGAQRNADRHGVGQVGDEHESSWKPGTLDSTPPSFVCATIAVMRSISPIKGPGFFTDAFGDQTPHVVSTDIDECYDCDNFTDNQRRGAIAKNEAEVLVPLERDGGYAEIVDVCEEAYKLEREEYLKLLRRNGVAIPGDDETDEDRRYPSALFALMARDTSANFGLRANSPGAPKWRIYEKGSRKYDYWRLYGFITMALQSNDMKLRLIVLVAPWCRWIMCKKGTRMGMGQMELAFRSACASTFPGLLLEVLCTERTTVNRSLDRPVSEIPVVLYSVFLSAHEPVHAPHRPQHQRAGQELSHGQEPALQRVHELAQDEAHRQVANLPDGDDSDEEAEEDDDDEDDSVCSDDGGLEWDDEPGTTSSAEAEKKKRRREKADRKFIHRVVCHLMRAGPGDDKAFEDVALPAAYHYITHNRSGVRMSSDAINKRFKYLRGANIIRGSVLSALSEKREADLPNKGNRTGNYHSPTAETQKTSDDGLRHYAKTGGDFRLQVAGVAAPGACIKADGTPWDPQQHPRRRKGHPHLQHEEEPAHYRDHLLGQQDFRAGESLGGPVKQKNRHW